jgi:hypothetical protein
VTPATAVNATSLLIPDYDLQHVTSIYHCYLYTGDRAFLQEQWAVAKKVITFFSNLIDPQTKLLFPPALFGPPSADTLTNAHFYGVLLHPVRADQG